jgi:hypothetical protein
VTLLSDICASSIGFVRVGAAGRALLGSGTLVAAGEARAILTAISVLDRLDGLERIGITLRTDLNQIMLDPSDLTRQRLTVDADAELGLARLSAHAARRLGETRRFVDLLTPPAGAPESEAGWEWRVTGFSSELTLTQLPLDCFDMVVGYTGVIGVPTEPVQVANGKLRVPVRGVSETGEALPLDGLLGGGLWQVRYDLDEVARYSGVVISAPENAATSGTVRCLGPAAITTALSLLHH